MDSPHQMSLAGNPARLTERPHLYQFWQSAGRMAVRLGSRGVEGRHVGSMAGGVAVTAAVSDQLLRRSGQPSRTVRCGLRAGPIFQGCPSVAGVVLRHGSSSGSSHTERHSAVCHLVKARPVRYGSPSGPTLRTTSTDDAWRGERGEMAEGEKPLSAMTLVVRNREP